MSPYHMKQLCWTLWLMGHTLILRMGLQMRGRWTRWVLLAAWTAATFWWIGPRIQEL